MNFTYDPSGGPAESLNFYSVFSYPEQETIKKLMAHIQWRELVNPEKIIIDCGECALLEHDTSISGEFYDIKFKEYIIQFHYRYTDSQYTIYNIEFDYNSEKYKELLDEDIILES